MDNFHQCNSVGVYGFAVVEVSDEHAVNVMLDPRFGVWHGNAPDNRVMFRVARQLRFTRQNRD